METALIVSQQTLLMFAMMAVGVLLFKTGKISREGSKSMANILLYAIIPCVIINAFPAQYTPEKGREVLVSLLLAAVGLGIAMVVAGLVFKKHPVDNFATAFSNAGFFGIPLVQAAFGAEAVGYIAMLVAVLNVLQWTYGVRVLTGEKGRPSLKKLLANPILIALALGLLRFYLGLPLPGLVATGLGYVAAMNAPVAMIVLGVYLAQTNVLEMLREGMLYKVALVRLVVVPALTIAVFSLLPASLDPMRMVLLICLAAPVGSNVAVYAELNGQDCRHAVKTVAFSTVLSIISIPLVVMAASMLWGT